MGESDQLIELAAEIDHGEPDYTVLDQAIELVTDPWEALRGVLRQLHAQYL